MKIDRARSGACMANYTYKLASMESTICSSVSILVACILI